MPLQRAIDGNQVRAYRESRQERQRELAKRERERNAKS